MRGANCPTVCQGREHRSNEMDLDLAPGATEGAGEVFSQLMSVTVLRSRALRALESSSDDLPRWPNKIESRKKSRQTIG